MNTQVDVCSAARRYSWKIHNICSPNYMEIIPNVHVLHRPTPLRAMVVSALHVLTGVTNIEFSILQVALPNTITAQRRDTRASILFIVLHVMGA